MLTETLFDLSPVWLLYAGTVLMLLLGKELGYRLGVWRRSRMPEAERSAAATMMGSTLGLLAFMLAFTFGMSSTRFDLRRQLVLDEASAVLRTYQRAQLLPESQRAECSRLLREYLGLRNRISMMKDLSETQEAALLSERVQDALWREAKALSDRPSPILTAFTQSLAELTDLQMRRVRAAVWNRIPPTIVVTLYAIAFLALSAMGFGAGLAESRATIPAVMLILAFSTIIVLILDLERPRQQLFKVSQEPMADVTRRMQSLQP